MSRTPYCRAHLNYSVAPAAQGANGETTVAVEVTIADGRTADLAFEDCGFRVLEHAVDVDRRWSVREWGERHGPAIAEVARELTGCDTTLTYPAIIRSPQAAREVPDYAPIEFVHSDFTEDYRPMVESAGRPYREYIMPLLDRAGLAQADVACAERVVMLQFWRNIGPELPDHPLALCDARSVPRSELLPFTVAEYGGAHLEFETFAVRAPADPSAHHWYTFPRLTADELIMFRTYDSRCIEEGRPFWTPHSAFRDPHAGPDAPARESVEIRILCLFGV